MVAPLIVRFRWLAGVCVQTPRGIRLTSSLVQGWLGLVSRCTMPFDPQSSLGPPLVQGIRRGVETHRAGVDGVPVLRLFCELNAIIRQNRLGLIGRGLEHVLQKFPGCFSVGIYNELGDGELGRLVNSDKEKELVLGSLHLGNVDVKESDGITLEFPALGLATFDIRHARDAVPLQTAVQR